MNGKSAIHCGIKGGPHSQNKMLNSQPNWPLSGLISQTGEFPGWMAHTGLAHTRDDGNDVIIPIVSHPNNDE